MHYFMESHHRCYIYIVETSKALNHSRTDTKRTTKVGVNHKFWSVPALEKSFKYQQENYICKMKSVLDKSRRNTTQQLA